ncbi:MAG: SDR family oxidoreductase [Candidatus Aminicenantes bacterium]|nr:SDR family oxidoreductase [Candidatus Aminicenantes bacterium]
MNGLKGKNILITGGAGGIGKATALRFLEEGARVFILDRDEEALHSVETELNGIQAAVKADVSIREDLDRAFEELDTKWRALDVLINNAGISIRKPFLEIMEEEWKKVMEINLNGVFFTAQKAAERMKIQGKGVILNMGSTNALTGYPYYASYNAAKAGVVELTRSMALELAPGIRVNAVCPGFILTPMQEAEYTQEMIRDFSAKVPLRRLGKPEEVAALFAFLASDDAAYITGQTFVIDGGELAGGLASR